MEGGWRSLITFRGAERRGTMMMLGILSFIIVLVLWWGAAALKLLPPQYLPSPGAVVVRFYDLLVKYGFIGDIGISIFRVWTAFLISAAMAIPFGIMMSSFPIVNGMSQSLIDFIRYLPVPALVPLTIIWLGIGEASKIALLWLGTFFQLVLLVADDARRVPREYIEIGLTTGAKPRHILGSIVLPAMLPSMVDNLRITLGWCWTYLIIAEIVAADSGIGYVIMSARRYVKTDEVMAGILAIGIIGLATDQAIRWLHRRWFIYLT
ncbi:ABC transporter permease [Dongia deserti]|uniref:ABC transporter permease n=1 Tax=Dongia deserti TaxID=2268030 RepID=UPI000E64B687|nr:ABC transporter permease [Dongia deserti]